MLRSPSAAAILLATLAAAAGAQQHALSTAEIAKRAIPATVTILTFDGRGDTLGLGSGFVIRGDGVIVTNWHVMAGAASAVVIFPNGERYSRVSGLDGDSGADVALIKVPGSSLAALRTRDELPPVGARIVAIGSPLGLSQTVTDGIVSGERMLDGRELMQMSVPISHGSSGGPVMNAAGEVVAISTAFLADGQALNFAVPVRYAVGLLSERPRGRPLAQVFATKGDGAAGVPGAGGQAWPFDTPASRTARPRASLAGTYRGAGVVRALSDACHVGDSRRDHYLPAWETLIVLGGDGNGWLVAAAGSDSSQRMIGRVMWASNVAGQALLTVNGDDFDGYQTDDGFFLSATGQPDSTGCAWDIRLFAEGAELPLSQSDGRYDAHVRTEHFSAGAGGSFLDWSGELDAVVGGDSIYVAIKLGNETGGSSEALMAGPLTNGGEFDLLVRDDKGAPSFALKGVLRGGRIAGDWTDYREGSEYFIGRLIAERR